MIHFLMENARVEQHGPMWWVLHPTHDVLLASCDTQKDAEALRDLLNDIGRQISAVFVTAERRVDDPDAMGMAHFSMAAQFPGRTGKVTEVHGFVYLNGALLKKGDVVRQGDKLIMGSTDAALSTEEV